MNYIKFSLMSLFLLSSNFALSSTAAAADCAKNSEVAVWVARFAHHKHPSKQLRIFPSVNTSADIMFGSIKVAQGEVPLETFKDLAAKEWSLDSKSISLLRVIEHPRTDDNGKRTVYCCRKND